MSFWEIKTKPTFSSESYILLVSNVNGISLQYATVDKQVASVAKLLLQMSVV